MGKFKSWKYHTLFTDIATSTCLIGATSGLVFGVSAGTFKVEYMDLENAQARLDSSNSAHEYYSQDIGSEWNMDQSLDPHNQTITEESWKSLHHWYPNEDKTKQPEFAPMLNYDPIAKKEYDINPPEGQKTITDTQIKNRYNYISMVIDGATHSTMDRSFNQGLYNGLVDFIKNQSIASTKLDAETNNDPVNKNCARSFKPGADNTTEFVNIYSSVAKTFRIIGLAGFNHVSYLEALGKRNEEDHLFHFKNTDFYKTAMLLIDGDVTNNQNISSVLFRADQPGWMAGIATSMYFLNNLHLYHDQHQDLSIGAYGGTMIPTVMAYMGGVQRGVEFFDTFILKKKIINVEMSDYLTIPEAKVQNFTDTHDTKLLDNLIKYSKYKDEIEKFMENSRAGGYDPATMSEQLSNILTNLYNEYKVHMIKLGAASTHFSGTFAAGDAIGITKQYLNRGAGAIIAVAGPQSLDTAQEVQNQNSKAIVIGVDTAMEEGDYQRKQTSTNYADLSEAPDGSKPTQANNIIKFSAIKDITNVTKKFANLCAQNKNFDVQAKHVWEHNTYPTRVMSSDTPAEERGEIEEQVIPDDAFTIENGYITGLNPDFAGDKSKYTIVRIPESVDGIAANGFKDFFNSKGYFPNVTRIVFNSKADFVILNNAFDNCENIDTLDFTNNLSDFEIQSIEVHPLDGFRVASTSLSGISKNKTKENVGSIYFTRDNKVLSSEEKDNNTHKICEYGGLSDGDITKEKWFKINPDIGKSVCNIGYKTCGNVENGLISISWDGWCPFIQAIKHAYSKSIYVKEWGSKYPDFIKEWVNCFDYHYCREYGSEKLQQEIGQDWNKFNEAIRNIDSLITYDSTSVIHKYYSHVIGNLGWLMKNADITFTPNDTITIDKYGNSCIPEHDVQMSILDWLRLNMYFTC